MKFLRTFFSRQSPSTASPSRNRGIRRTCTGASRLVLPALFAVALGGAAAAQTSAPGAPTNVKMTASATIATAIPGVWINKSEIAALPMSGSAWTALLSRANTTCTTPDLSNQDDMANVCVLAKALVFARTGATSYRTGVISALTYIASYGTYSGRALALGRELAAYVIAADVIDLKTYDPTLDGRFCTKIKQLVTTYTSGGPSNLIECHELRPNNWGTLCGGSRAAVAAYLNDQVEIDRIAKVFKGWVGDRASYVGFKFQTTATQDARTWSPTPIAMVPVNPASATVLWNGKAYNVAGAVIDDISRGCATFQWPPCHTGYAWEGLAGAVVQAEILHRRGYPAYEWQTQALRRAYEDPLWLHNTTGGYWFDEGTISGDDNWQPWLANKRYGIHLPTRTPTKPGKQMGFSDWTHGQ